MRSPVPRDHWARGALQALLVGSGALVGNLIGGNVGSIIGAAAAGAASTQIPDFQEAELSQSRRRLNPASRLVTAVVFDVRTRAERKDDQRPGSVLLAPVSLGPDWIPYLRAVTKGSKAVGVLGRGPRASYVKSWLASHGVRVVDVH